MQLDPGYPVVPRGFHSRPCDCFHRWNPTYDNPLPNFACFAFNCKLRHYIMALPRVAAYYEALGGDVAPGGI